MDLVKLQSLLFTLGINPESLPGPARKALCNLLAARFPSTIIHPSARGPLHACLTGPLSVLDSAWAGTLSPSYSRGSFSSLPICQRKCLFFMRPSQASRWQLGAFPHLHSPSNISFPSWHLKPRTMVRFICIYMLPCPLVLKSHVIKAESTLVDLVSPAWSPEPGTQQVPGVEYKCSLKTNTESWASLHLPHTHVLQSI